MSEYDTLHLFNFTHISTILDQESLWLNPVGAVALLDEWTAAPARAHKPELLWVNIYIYKRLPLKTQNLPGLSTPKVPSSNHDYPVRKYLMNT